MTATDAVITMSRRHGLRRGLTFRVSLALGSPMLVFHAAHVVVVIARGRLYRIGAWLRSDVPGLNVCLRIKEIALRHPTRMVRKSKSCFSPTGRWKHFVVYRRTLARGDTFRFSIYSHGATARDSFDVDRFVVAVRVKHGWRRVRAVLRGGLLH